MAPKLLFLQEIWVPYSEENSMNNMYHDYSVLISTPDMLTPPEDLLCTSDHTWHGSAIMWHASINSNIITLKTNNDRIVAVRMSLNNQLFLIFSIYFPTSGKDPEYLDCISDLTSLITEHRNKSENRHRL